MKQQFQSAQQKQMYFFLMLLIVAATVGLQGWRTLFNNFAVDQVGINGFQVGVIQSVRELPGFLTFLVIYVLLIIKEARLSIVSVFVLGAGVFIAGMFDSFAGLVLTTFLFSTGFHYFETTSRSLTIQNFTQQQSPIIFGKQQSWKAITNIVIGLLLLLTTQFFQLKLNFMMIGVFVVVLAIVVLFLQPKEINTTAQQKKMILKKKYWLFYALNFLSGARRQIFVVFAVFMLVEQYHLSVMLITILFVFNNIVTYFMAPLIGKGINKYGERTMLSMEYAAMILVFLGYAFFHSGWLIALLYIIDNIFFSFAMGINTFFHKICDKEDVAPSMAVGFTINHISAVVVPVIGGMLWLVHYQIPYFIGVILAIGSLLLVQLIPNVIAKSKIEK